MISIEKLIDTLGLIYCLYLFPIPFFWLLIHPAIRFWRRFGNWSFWIAVPVWLVIGTVIILMRGRLFEERIPRSAVTWVLGGGLLVLANWLGVRIVRDFGLRRLVGVREMNPDRESGGLVSSGIYGHLRHPRYLEYLLELLGWALLTGAVGIFLLAILSVLLYQITAPLEERELREQYGQQYEAYARAVPRFLPCLGRKTEPQTLP
jgi:protein-S-isoprenylcysteine O-methyltransferase Ste14